MQQILCMHRITLLYSESVALSVTKGLFAWVLAVQPKSGLSLVYLKKELFKFSLTASIMVPCMSCHLFQDITYKSFAFCSTSSNLLSFRASEGCAMI